MIVKVRNIDFYIERCKARKIPFKIEQTLSTTKLYFDDKVYHYVENTSKLNNYELNLINRVKKDIQNCTLKSEVLPTKYIDLDEKKNFESKEQIYELDLNASYWNIAHKNNFISNDTYKYALENKKISKKARLISLGALAKKTHTTYFDGRQFTRYEERDNINKDYFFYITRKNYEIMSVLKLIANKDYLFYWVDAIFFKGNEALKNITNYLIKENIGYKIYKIDSIIKDEDKINVNSVEHKNNIRQFNFKKDKKRKLYDNDFYIVYKTDDNNEYIEKYNKLDFKKYIDNKLITHTRIITKKLYFYKITCESKEKNIFSYIFSVHTEKQVEEIKKIYSKNAKIINIEKINI